MLYKKIILCIWLVIIGLFTMSSTHADENPLGQTIQIKTRFHSFVGKPSWLLVIRDVDNGIVYPYLYDITRGEDFFLAYTYSRNYLITVSRLQFSPYRTDPYRSKKIENFCNLQSNGRIVRGQSIIINISGNLTPNTNTFTCHVLKYADTNFTVVQPASAD